MGTPSKRVRRDNTRQLSSSSIVAPTLGRGAGWSERAHRPPLVLDAQDVRGRHRILLGAALPRRGQVQALVCALPCPDPGAVQALDRVPLPVIPLWSRIRAADALKGAGLALKEIAVALGVSHASEVSRLIALARVDGELGAQIRAGALRFSQAHLLARARLPIERRDALARQAAVQDWSVAAVKRALSTPSPAPGAGRPRDVQIEDADLASWISRIGERLGTQPRIHRAGDRWNLEIDWFTLADLQGLFETLGRGHIETVGAGKRRTVRLEDLGGAELSDLFAHLEDSQ